jgi:hypothetical protein
MISSFMVGLRTPDRVDRFELTLVTGVAGYGARRTPSIGYNSIPAVTIVMPGLVPDIHDNQ